MVIHCVCWLEENEILKARDPHTTTAAVALRETRVGPRALLLWLVHVRADDHETAVDDHGDRQNKTSDRIQKPVAFVESNHLAAEYDQHGKQKINDRTNCCCWARRREEERRGQIKILNLNGNVNLVLLIRLCNWKGRLRSGVQERR